MATKRVPLLAGPPRCPASFEASLDLVDDDGAVATLPPTPAHPDQALALSDAFGEGFGCGAHRAVAFEVGFVFGAEALDDVVALHLNVRRRIQCFQVLPFAVKLRLCS